MRRRVAEVTADDRAVLCDLVRLELWNGAGSAKEQRLLRELEEELETVPTTDDVWARSRELARQARSRGFTVPAADLVIAACAEHHGLGLIHRDAHFTQLARLQAETQ